jgi:tRNA1Val (adenine37-N6)-methyltransferase
MKVCTDSCLFGAYVADKIESQFIQPTRILDIGSGTGLLSLMVAQKTDAIIDTVEIDENSYHQTKENLDKSQWHQRLQPFHTDIKSFTAPYQYDLIISNPPFFENDLKSTHKNKNVAKHHDSLTFQELIHCVTKNLESNGTFLVLLPFHRTGYFKKIAAENNFYLKEEMLIKQTPKHNYFRGILFFATKPQSVVSRELTIKDEEGKYTRNFNFFLKDYYL